MSDFICWMNSHRDGYEKEDYGLLTVVSRGIPILRYVPLKESESLSSGQPAVYASIWHMSRWRMMLLSTTEPSHPINSYAIFAIIQMILQSPNV